MGNFIDNKKYHFIYKTTNLLNEMFYIGMHSTNKLNDGYYGSGKRLKRSIKKYGKTNFKFEILEYLPNRKLLAKRESEIVNSELINDVFCLNLKEGGFGGGGFSNDEHRKKFIEAGPKASKLVGNSAAINKVKFLFENDTEWVEDFKLKVKSGIESKFKNGVWFGKNHTNESKLLISLNNKGKKIGSNNSQFGTIWITNGVENKKINKFDEIPNNWYRGRVLKK